MSCCQDGFGSYGEQPLPAPPEALPQAVSLQPVPELPVRLVPPTATTYGDDAGYSTPWM